MESTGMDWKTPWERNVMPLGKMTGDRRWFDRGGVTSRSLPVPLCLQVRTDQGHRGAVVVGLAEWISFEESMVRAGGSWLDPEYVPEVLRALELYRNGVAQISADLEPDMDITIQEGEPGQRPTIYCHRAKICGFTIVPIAAFDNPQEKPPTMLVEPDEPDESSLALTGTTSWRTMPAQPREVEYNADEAFKRILAWADGDDSKARSMFLWYDPEAAEGVRDRFRLPIGDIVNGRPALNFHAIYAAAALISGAHGGLPTVSGEERERMRRTVSEIYRRLGGLYGDAALVAPWDKRAKMPDVTASGLDAVTASAIPLAPPDHWFRDPGLPGPTPSPIVTPEGRVAVHLATHGSCHRGVMQVSGECFQPPPSPSNYARYMDGHVVTASGATIPVGRIMAGTTHPMLNLGAGPTRRHYDDTGTCVAVVAAGEDDYGIWLAGSLVPEATAQQVAMLRRSPVSGDWRKHGSDGLDLVAALCVNVAGYPVDPRLGATRTLSVSGGEAWALVASGPPAGDDEVMSDVLSSDQGGEAPGVSDEGPASGEAAASAEELVNRAAAAAADLVWSRGERAGRLATLMAVQQRGLSDRLGRLSDLSALSPVTVAARIRARREGEALPPLREGGTPRYPIRNAQDLENAIRAVGRGKGSHDEIRRWIIRRAKEMKMEEKIPENWNSDGSLKV